MVKPHNFFKKPNLLVGSAQGPGWTRDHGPKKSMVNRMAEFIIPGATLQVGEIDVKYMRIYQDGVFLGFGV